MTDAMHQMRDRIQTLENERKNQHHTLKSTHPTKTLGTHSVTTRDIRIQQREPAHQTHKPRIEPSWGQMPMHVVNRNAERSREYHTQQHNISHRHMNNMPQHNAQQHTPYRPPHSRHNPYRPYHNPFSRNGMNRWGEREDCDPTREVVLKGIPYREGEDLRAIVGQAASKAGREAGGIELKHTDYTCHRALQRGKDRKHLENNTKTPNIMIVLQTCRQKDMIVRRPPQQITVAHINIHTNPPENAHELKVYFGESLTKQQAHIFWMARKNKEDLGFKYAWTRDGVTYLRVKEGMKPVRVDTREKMIEMIEISHKRRQKEEDSQKERETRLDQRQQS